MMSACGQELKASPRAALSLGLSLAMAIVWHHSLTHGSDTRTKITESAAESDDRKTSVKLKIGALFDVRARHLVEAFQNAVDIHNAGETDEIGNNASKDLDHQEHMRVEDVIKIFFEPVITFVDVTDSFAVSNAMCDLIAHDVIAILGITNASSLPTIQSYSATFHVPFLSLGSSQNVTSTTPFQLSLRPPLMGAVVDMLQHQGCSSALYMYDSDEGLMRIQDLFQAINIREVYLELDVRRIGDRGYVTEISKIIAALHPQREICLVLDVERLEATAVIKVISNRAPTVKDVILVTLDAEMAIRSLTQDPDSLPLVFNISGLQLVPSSLPSTTLQFHPRPHQSFHRWPNPSPSEDYINQRHVQKELNRDLDVKVLSKQQRNKLDSFTFPKSGTDTANGRSHTQSSGSAKSEQSELSHDKQSERTDFHSNHGRPDGVVDKVAETDGVPVDSSPDDSVQSVAHSCDALIADCFKVLTAALAELWESLGDLFQSSSEASQQDMSIKCTNFVVEKKQYGADLMEALRLVHVQGDTRHISFDTAGRRADYSLSVLSVRAGSTLLTNEGEWSSVSGMTSHLSSRHGVRSYTIFGNVSRQAGRRVLLGVTE